MARQSTKKSDKDSASKSDAKARGKAASQASEDMLGHLETLRAELSKLSDRVTDLGNEPLRAGKENLRKDGKRAIRKAGSVLTDVADKTEDAISQAESFSRERPVLVMGMAAAAGLFLALSMSRRG